MPPIKRPSAPKAKPAPPSKRSKANEEEEQEEEDSQLDSSEEVQSGNTSGDDEFPENSEDGGEEQGDDDDVSEIQVEFEFFDPEEKDFLGLKALLSNYLNGELFDSSGFIDAIIQEGDIGSVVKTDEDDDPIAIMTVLNTTQYKQAAWMKQIHEFLVASCPNSAAAAKEGLTKALSSQGTGLIVNERLLNAPPKLGPPLLQFLMQEIQERAQGDAADAKLFQFKRYLLATRVWLEQNTAAGTSQGQEEQEPGPSKQKAKAPKQSASQSPTLVFVRPEDEFLHQHCAWSFTVPVPGRPVTKDGLMAHRLVMQVDAEHVPAAQAELDRVVGNMAAGMQAWDDQQGPGEEAPAAGPSKRREPAVKAAGGSGGGQQDIEQMAAEMFAAAAAAGAGKGAAQRGKQKQKAGKVKAVTL